MRRAARIPNMRAAAVSRHQPAGVQHRTERDNIISQKVGFLRGGTLTLVALGWLLLSTGTVHGGTVFNPETDFAAGFTNGTNPNGVWSYGWSSGLLQPLNLYTVHETITFGYTFESWHDPTNYSAFTPLVDLHLGAAFYDGNVDIPAGGLLMHYGGIPFTNYTHVVFTAPSDGTYDVEMTFTGRQVNVNSDVHVLDNATSLLSVLIDADGQSASYSGSLFLHAGDTLDFTTGPGTAVGGPNPGIIQLAGTITEFDSAAIPEPGSLLIFGGLGAVMGLVVMRRRAPQSGPVKSGPTV